MEDGISLLDALREELGCRSVKDGCSPQGQCGCCTVWVDGAPRVACVTPVRRIAGRQVTTLEGAPAELRDRWAAAFVEHGASQCGFCTPGIVLRLAALEGAPTGRPPTRRDIESALRAHLCRCTGWQSIVDAACSALGVDGAASPSAGDPRNPVLAAWRAQVEGPAFQSSGPDVVLGGGGFADDSAPSDALVQLGADGPLATGLRAARAGTGRVQGRNSTVPLSHPVALPDGDWALTLQTSWLEPAYVEPDASWSRPGQSPASPLANGGAFGGKRHSPVPTDARELADATGDVVRVLWRREDVVRRGPKRPPLAIALRADGTGVVRVGRTAAFGRPRTTGGPCAGVLPRRRGRDGRRGRTAGVVRPARRGLGRGARGAGRARALTDARRWPRRGARRRPRCRQRKSGARRCRRGRAAGSRWTCGRARSSVP